MINAQRLFKIILAPCVTEKTVRLGVASQYAFKVLTDATQREVKVAVEKLFNVTVLAVNTLNVKPKRCRNKGKPGVRKGWKKAYVTLKSGDTIDVFDKKNAVTE